MPRVLSTYDDFPIHQTTRPIGHAADGDLNRYDRYFFNGTDADRGLCFGLAMGLYPNRHVADAAFSVLVDGGTLAARQVSVFASQRAPTDRRDANEVGPIRVEVVEPLATLRLHVDAPEQGLRAELTFSRRSAPVEEPHFLHTQGVRVVFDYTRLTQFGSWSGWMEVDGVRIDLDGGVLGCRDRSWGIRPVGERGSTGAPVADPQFFWLWAPLNFPALSTHFDVNELTDGTRWHTAGFVVPEGGEPYELADVVRRLTWEPGTRRFATCELDLVPHRGEPTTIRLERRFDFHMRGLGYLHPEWGHGVWKGELVVGGERLDLPVEDPVAPHHLHVQSVVTAHATGGLGDIEGVGILEQLAIGRHVPTGLEGLFDGLADPDTAHDAGRTADPNTADPNAVDPGFVDPSAAEPGV